MSQSGVTDARREALHLATSVLRKKGSAATAASLGPAPVARGLAPILSPPSGRMKEREHGSAAAAEAHEPTTGVESPRDIHVLAHVETHHAAPIPPPAAVPASVSAAPPASEEPAKSAIDEDLSAATLATASRSPLVSPAPVLSPVAPPPERLFVEELRELAQLRVSAGSAEGEIAALCDLLAQEREAHQRTKLELRQVKEAAETYRGGIALKDSAAAHATLHTRALEGKVEHLERKLLSAEDAASSACFREGEMYKLAAEAQRQLAVACAELERFHCVPPPLADPAAAVIAAASPTAPVIVAPPLPIVSAAAPPPAADLDALRRGADEAQEAYNAALQVLQTTRTGSGSRARHLTSP